MGSTLSYFCAQLVQHLLTTYKRHRRRGDPAHGSGCGRAGAGGSPATAAAVERQWPSYLSGQLASWLADLEITHTRGKPYHPMTQGKIERYHRSMKNQILLENYYLPGQLEALLVEFVAYYNTRRYHESLGNLTPADIYCGRGQTILTRRHKIKLKTIELRRKLHHQAVA
jgi:transposase InsO family protein